MFDVKINQLATTDLTNVKELRKEAGANKEFNFNAFYMAIVEDTNDPLKLGRVRIRIPALHGGTKDNTFYVENEALPWAKPAILNGAGNDVGQFIIPTKGTRVFVTFEYNSRQHPIYFGGVVTNVKKSTKEYNDNSEVFDGQEFIISTDDRIKDIDGEAYQVIYKSFKGATILVNDKDGEETLKIIDAAGQQIIMKNSSDYALPRRENSTNPPETASIEVHTNGELTLGCNSFNLQASNTNLQDYVITEGTGDKTYVHTQSVPSDTWEITHNLGKYPSVSVIDSAGTQVQGEVTYSSINKATIKFSVAFSGKATLN